MHQHLAERRPFAAADDQHVARVGMPQHGRLHEQLMVDRLVLFGALNRAVEHQHPAVVDRVGDQHILIGRPPAVDDRREPVRVLVERIGVFDEHERAIADRRGIDRLDIKPIRRQRRQRIGARD